MIGNFMRKRKMVFLLFAGLFWHCQPPVVVQQEPIQTQESEVVADTVEQFIPELKIESPKLGIENFYENFAEKWQDKTIGLVTNQTGILPDGRTNIEYLAEKIEIQKIFSPEHGFWGIELAGNGDENHAFIQSLYRKTPEKIAKEFANLDLVLFDIQDVGVRPYTFLTTMVKAMKASEIADVPFFILDRPNPIGEVISGAVLDSMFLSDIGALPVPYCHGMTLGELAKFAQNLGIGATTEIIPMQNWSSADGFSAFGIHWIPSSPHIPKLETISPFATFGAIGELGVISEGVGWTLPFEVLGAPWVSADFPLADSLNSLNLSGISFRKISFKPFYGRFKNKTCHGVQLIIAESGISDPFWSGIAILEKLICLFPEIEFFADKTGVRMFDLACGTDKIRIGLQNGKLVDEIIMEQKPKFEQFSEFREQFLIYKSKAQ